MQCKPRRRIGGTALAREPKQARIERLESWLDQFGDELYSYVHQQTKNPVTTEEILLHVFISAYEKTRITANLAAPLEWLRSQAIFEIELTTAEFRQDGSDVLGADENKMPERVEGLPPSTRIRIRKTLQATALMADVRQKLSAGRWMKIAVSLTLIVGLTAVVAGLYRPNSAKPTVSSSVKDSTVPTPLQNLPVTTLGQYLLKGNLTSRDLSHFTVNGQTIYRTELHAATNGALSLEILRGSLTTDGWNLEKAMKKYTAISITSPPSSSGYWPRALLEPGVNWHLSNWGFSIVNGWGVITTAWSRNSATHDEAAQLYIVNLRTGKVTTSRSWAPEWHLANQYNIAMGQNRIVVESAVQGSSKVSGTNLTALPLQLFTVSKNSGGTLQSIGQVDSSFGFGQDPTVYSGGVVFQSVESDTATAQPTDQLDSTWYKVDYRGELTKLTGPPLDGQPHWTVYGTTGQLWWVETTPDSIQPNKDYQVVMAPLAPESSGQAPADTLSGSVLSFSASGHYLLWVQNVLGIKELVVAEVQ